MKSHSLMSSVVMSVAAVAGALELGKGIINTFSFDIFRKCVDGELDLTSATCQYGPQVSINLLAALIFFGFGLYMMKRGIGIVTSKAGLALLSVLLFAVLTAIWRTQVSLQDNFLIVSGPACFTEYLYVGYVWLDTVVAGVVIGVFAWLPGVVNAAAKERKEPRIKFVSKKS